MTAEQILNLVINGGGFAVVVYLLQQQQREARADREWMKSVLWFLIQTNVPGADLESVPGTPPAVATAARQDANEH